MRGERLIFFFGSSSGKSSCFSSSFIIMSRCGVACLKSLRILYSTRGGSSVGTRFFSFF